MTTVLLWLLLSQAPPDGAGERFSWFEEPRALASGGFFAKPDDRASGQTNNLLKSVVDSGRVLSLVRSLDEKVLIAPGAPPLLTFRYLEGRQRGRFGGLDLVLDDAGH